MVPIWIRHYLKCLNLCVNVLNHYPLPCEPFVIRFFPLGQFMLLTFLNRALRCLRAVFQSLDTLNPFALLLTRWHLFQLCPCTIWNHAHCPSPPWHPLFLCSSVLWLPASLWHGAFFPRTTLFLPFFRAVYGAFGYIRHRVFNDVRRFFENFFTRQLECLVFCKRAFHPLNAFTYCAFAFTVVRADAFHRPVFPVVFQGCH